MDVQSVLRALSVELAVPLEFYGEGDPLPGGLEALNERLNTTSHDARVQESPR